MGKIKNIVFDFGGVLLDWNPRYFYRTYFKSEEEMEHFLANICTPKWNEEQDRGRSFDEGVSILQAQHPEHSEAIALFRDRWADMLKRELPDAVDMLRKLKADGYEIYGLSNWSAETIPTAFRRYDFFKLFDGIVVSGEEKLIKPDKRIYEVMLKRYNLNPEESVFIDDNSNNIQAANELGFKAILFDHIENVQKQITALLTC